VIEWINAAMSYPLFEALVNKDVAFFEKISEDFAMGASDGVFQGCIGALDGLAIRIKKPDKGSSIVDPGAYYCRKGFYALNCQAICDSKKRILWMSSAHQGSCHDSTAFQSTVLHRLIKEEMSDWLYENEWFFVGDSAYCMESYLLTPFDKPQMKSSIGQKEDAYNFYHSSCRITIECTFGELVMRWGIFWRRLLVDIGAVGGLVSACGLLHNYIIDHRLQQDNEDDVNYFAGFDHNTLNSSDSAMDECPIATVTGTDQLKPRGRPTGDEKLSKEKGLLLRRSMLLRIISKGLLRPSQHGFKYNQYGMIYME
jgi:hypothetical protein